jgi:hypothetical protein
MMSTKKRAEEAGVEVQFWSLEKKKKMCVCVRLKKKVNGNRQGTKRSYEGGKGKPRGRKPMVQVSCARKCGT